MLRGNLTMKCRMGWAITLVALLWAAPTKADTGVIVRTTNLEALQTLCAVPTTCTVVGGLDGTLRQLFLVNTPLPLQTLLGLLKPVTGFVSAEVDQVISLVGPLLLPSPLPATLMQDRTQVPTLQIPRPWCGTVMPISRRQPSWRFRQRKAYST